MEFLDRGNLDYEVEQHCVSHIVNYNEQLVLQALRERYADDQAPCRCAHCIEDVYALALNGLPARYIQATSLKKYLASETFIGLDEVRAHVDRAVARVSIRPNH